MVDNNLLPDKYPQNDLFICDVADAVLKDIMPQMEHPFYSLSKKPDINIRRYEHNGNWLEITPSVKGIATIYDKDVLIYAISQLMAKLNRGEKISQYIRINCHEALMFTNRGTAGKDYKALTEAIDRLAGTRISTNIVTGNTEKYSNFGLIENGSVERKNGRDGRILWIDLKISDWVFDSIRNESVLTLHRDYFRLRRPIERRLYELSRKHCGDQKTWSIGLEKLHKKSGSKSPLKHFRGHIKEVCVTDHLPDYKITYEREKDKVTFTNRMNQKHITFKKPHLHSETYEKAKKYVGNNDVYAWEQEWLIFWEETGCPKLKNPDAAFIGFCKTRYVINKQELLI